MRRAGGLEGWRADLSKVLGRVIGKMATADPNAALGWLNQMSAHLLSDGVMRKLVRGWANQAPEDALLFVDSLPKDYRFGYSKGALRAAARIDLAEAWSTSDPEGAAAWFLAQPEDQRAPLLDKGLPLLAEHDLEWADGLVDLLGAENSRGHRRLLSKWIAQSPEEAADRLLEFAGEAE